MDKPAYLTKKYVNWLTYQVVGASIEVHRYWGPGLLESVYEKALRYELKLRGFQVESQKSIPVPYKDILLDVEFRYDLLVEGVLLVETKAVVDMHAIFEATLLSYMKHLRMPKGILLNFHVKNLHKEGLRVFVNEYFAALPEE